MKKEDPGQLLKKGKKPIVSELTGKKSVRTTLNLHKSAHDALDWLSKFYGITIKEVLDGTFKEEFVSGSKKLQEGYLNSEEEKQSNNKTEKNETTRKTYVLSERSLKVLDREAKNFSSRDGLASVLVMLHLAIAKSHEEKRRNALELIRNFSVKAEEIEKEVRELVGEDDQISEAFSYLVNRLMDFEDNYDLLI